jgi:transcriptional regulator with XRE-family HTH domain
MLPKGAQLRAARALLGWSQRDLARAAAVHVNAVRYWEQQPWRSLRLIESSSPGAKRIIAALAAAGIELVCDPVGVNIDPVRYGKFERSVLRRRAS